MNLLDNPIIVTIKDNYTEVTIKKDCPNLTEFLELFENAIRAIGYSFKGKLTIEEEDE